LQIIAIHPNLESATRPMRKGWVITIIQARKLTLQRNFSPKRILVFNRKLDPFNGAIMRSLGVLSSFRRHRNGLVLCLHSVSASDSEAANFGAMAIRCEFLERMIVDLRRRGITLVSLSDALKLATNPSQPFIALTFDDGYRDNYEIAYPILKKFDVPFAIFLTTGLIDRTFPMWWHLLEHVIDRNAIIEYEGVKLASSTKRDKAIAYRLSAEYFRHLDQRDVISAIDALIAKNDSRLTRADAFDQALDWNMIGEMAGSGLATFGGHTVSHPLLRQLDRASLVAEIGGCRRRLREAGGIEPAYFARHGGRRIGPGCRRRSRVHSGLHDTCARPRIA
jgi:peptidoglycan/xylan/chitin deacetylase (PgdA/CDA1 family)